MLRERAMKSLPREGIRYRRMARHTEGIVIALSPGPCHPPLLPAVKIGCCCFLIPGDRDFCFGLIEASRGCVWSAGACVRRSHEPSGCDARHSQTRRQDNYSLHPNIHVDGLPLRIARIYIFGASSCREFRSRYGKDFIECPSPARACAMRGHHEND